MEGRDEFNPIFALCEQEPFLVLSDEEYQYETYSNYARSAKILAKKGIGYLIHEYLSTGIDNAIKIY